MFKKTAIALSLAMVAGSGMAAQSSTAATTSSNGSGASVGTNTSITAEFRALDSNGDGVISRAEAAKSPALAEAYDSFDTSDTIEDEGKSSMPSGITMEQFEAGMQAAHGKTGVVGSAVSGGETYTQMKDGSMKLKDKTSAMKSQMGDGRSNMKSRTMGSDSYDRNTQEMPASDRMQQSRDSMMNKGRESGSAMRDNVKTEAGGRMGQGRTMGSDAYDHGGNTSDNMGAHGAAEMERRTQTPTSTGAGIKAEPKANY